MINWDQFFQRRNFQFQTEKNQHWIVQIWSLCTKFHLKQKKCEFWIKITQKADFQSKMSASNSALSNNFDFTGPNLPKKSIYNLKQKKVNHYQIHRIRCSIATKFRLKLKKLTSASNLAYLNYTSIIFSLKQKKLISLSNSTYSN